MPSAPEIEIWFDQIVNRTLENMTFVKDSFHRVYTYYLVFFFFLMETNAEKTNAFPFPTRFLTTNASEKWVGNTILVSLASFS